MTRREFTYLSPDQVANEIIELISVTITQARQFPPLPPLERDLLLADLRSEIEAGLDEFVSGIIEGAANDRDQ